MKIQQSDIQRFIELACKMWKSSYEGDSQVVVLTFTERSCLIEMARDELLLTYLCNRVDTETSEQVITVLFELLQDCSDGSGVADLQSIVESGESCIVVKWSEGLVRRERMYAAQEPPKYHLIPDLAWRTVDERLVTQLQRTETETGSGEMAPGHCESRCPIELIATTTQ